MSDDLLTRLERFKTAIGLSPNEREVLDCAEAHIREQRELLDECERVIDGALFLRGRSIDEANALLTKLRKEQADE